MLLHKFKGFSGRIATTKDASGACLPEEDAPWLQIASCVVNVSDGPRIGASSADILRNVERDGFSMSSRKEAEMLSPL
jgi:hypothetical protein